MDVFGIKRTALCHGDNDSGVAARRESIDNDDPFIYCRIFTLVMYTQSRAIASSACPHDAVGISLRSALMQRSEVTSQTGPLAEPAVTLLALKWSLLQVCARGNKKMER